MDKNKTGKYLKYAIGEILLVMIGILLALQVNNWNELRKNRNLETKYLNGIVSNLNKDISELNVHFRTDTLIFDAQTELIKILSSQDININKNELKLNFYYSGYGVNWFEGQNIIFEDLKSSGKITFINSDNIRHKVQLYYRLFIETQKQEEYHNKLIDLYNNEYIQYFEVSSIFRTNQ